MGDLGQAIPLYERTLADSERVLGADHPDTLLSRNNLAGAYAQAGRIDDAITLLEQLVTDFERVLGPEHPHTLSARHNLALWREKAGDTAVHQPTD
ncbi:tetratricopeptide repeat protein [Streptomyces griseorubiginosus]|nr:tetratricopeptide repeat protein [Streptomyces griseorubiginosus]